MPLSRENARLAVKSHLVFNPIFLYAVFVFPVAIAPLFIAPADYRLYWGQPYFLSDSLVLTQILSVLALAFGLLVGGIAKRAIASSVLCEIDRRKFEIFLSVTWGLYIIAYIFWIASAMGKGLSLGVLAEIIRGENGAIYSAKRFYFASVSGITSWVQLGIPLGSLLAMKKVLYGKWDTPKLVLLFSLTAARSVLLSERLALIEVLAAFLLSASATGSIKMPRLSVLKALSFVAAGEFLLVFFFGLTEYFRSWLTHYSAMGTDYIKFVAYRILGYYATSLNNGALVYTAGTGREKFLAFLHFPFLTELLGYRDDPNATIDIFFSQSNPEFNNASGFLTPISLFGLAGGLLLIFFVGFASMRSYVNLSHGHLGPLLAYPLLLISLLEMPRLFYLADSRLLPALLACVLLPNVYQKVQSYPTGDFAGAK